MRYVCPAAKAALVLSSLALCAPLLRADSGFSVSGFNLVSQTEISPTTWNFQYSVQLTNSSSNAYATVIATVTSLNTQSVQIAAGQNTVTFSPVPMNSTVPGQNNIGLIVNRTVPFSFSNLQFTFQTTSAQPVANAGLDQTVQVGSTVFLNGSLSTNPSGIGTLTYDWQFTSKPPGSNAALSSPTVVNPTFVADVPGAFVFTLFVSNGLASSSALVTISTNSSPPVANAGLNQTVAQGATVTLNGSGSVDPNGKPLTYSWTLLNPDGSTGTLNGSTTVSPTFVASQLGTYTATLIVNDGTFSSKPSIVMVTTQNSAPMASAGLNQAVNVGSLVQLNGSGSTDVDGDPLTYRWSFLSVPPGSKATLSSPTLVNPTFTADQPGTYVVQLIVNDTHQDSLPSTVQITTNALLPPTANAGLNQTVKHGSTVSLSGTGSDPQGLPLTFQWSLTTVPFGSAATLNANTANASFVADVPGTFVAQLKVSDGFLSAFSTVTITTTNTAPVANAGSNQNVTVGTTVTLDGTKSIDADGDPITDLWSITSVPPGSTATLSAPRSSMPTFVPDLAGTYVFQLIVNDSFAQSNPATVMVTATTAVTITLTPNPLTVASNSSGPLTVMLSAPAGPTGQVVNLSSNNSAVASVPPTVNVPPNATGANVTVTTGTPGSAQITATASGFTGGSATVNVVNQNINLQTDLPTVGLTNTIHGTATVNGPAGPAVVVALSTNPTGIVNLQPSTLLITPGSSQTFSITGASVGQTTITASAPGFASGSVIEAVSLLGKITLPTNVTVAPNQSVAFPVTLVTAAPVGGVTITLLSSDTSRLTISPSSVFIAQGATAPATQPQVTGVAFGSASIIASAPGFTGDTESVSISATLSFSPNTLTIGTGATQNLTLNLSAPAPLGLSVNITATDPTVVTVPPSVLFTPGASSANVAVTGMKAGSTAVHANAFPNLADTSATVTVAALGALSVPSTLSVGTGQTVPLTVTLPNPAPAGGVTVTLVSSDLSRATVSSPVVIPTSGTSGTAQVTGVAPGSPVIVATATGFTSGSTNVTVTAGTAASITATGGSGQSATVNTAFALPLTALVKDNGGNPVSGASVTFTAPGSGASGTFFGGGTTATVTTNASGVATSPPFSANGTAGSYSVTASVGSLNASFSLTNSAGGAASITATSGSGQGTAVGTAFAAPLVATVKDAGGNPVSGVSVTFAAPLFGASGSFSGSGTSATAITNASGVATSPVFTANNTTGAYTVNAAASGVLVPASFSLTNNGGSPASITATSGSGQSATTNTAFAAPLVATVKDTGGNPVGGVTVTFTAPGSGASGTFTGGGNTATATTNASGIATSPVFTANGTAGGPYNVNASVAGVTTPASFSLTNNGAPPASITATSGGGQSAAVNTAFAAPLVATVKDAGGNPVAGVSVTFAAPGFGATGTFTGGVGLVAVTTNASGVATSPTFTANGTIGGPYNVNATVSGVFTAATFPLSNLAGTPASIVATAGTPQSATINTAFATQFTSTVRDSHNNVLSGVSVTYTAPSSGPSGTFPGGVLTATVITDASGWAAAPTFTANGIAGPYQVNSNVNGVSSPAVFSLTNNAGSPASITATSGGGQSTTVNAAFAAPLVATVKDAGGNPVSGVNVTFSAPGFGASGTFSGGVTLVTVATNASGVATSPAFTANGTPGAYAVTAAANGILTQASFALTNSAGTPGSIAASSGTPQSAAINTAFAAPLVALVKDTHGNPLSGVSVTFTAPGSGASATFFGGGTTATVTTGASGLATSPALTANATAGSYSITAAVNGVSTPTSFSLTNNAGAPASVTATSGGGQSAPVGTAFANPLVATVKDAGGNPVNGITVTFSAPIFGASAAFAGSTTISATTNASGMATSPTMTANGTIGGPYTITGSVNGVLTSATYSETNTGGPPASIVATSGSPQSAQINTAFAAPLVATVRDSGGNPSPGVAVTFTAPGSGASGTFAGGGTSAVATTNASGMATSPAFTGNGTAGGYTITGAVAGVGSPASFSLTNTAGPPASITATSGSPQSAQITTAFAAPFVATVKDAGGNPASGVSVTFTAPGSGASGSFAGGGTTASVTTNASGVATSPVFTANGTAGGPYNITASVSGVSTPASYAVTNTAGPPANISPTGGNGQIASIGSQFSLPLAAVVKDAGGNPISGASVTFTAPGSGASGTFAGGGTTATVTTNASGVATSPAFSANNTVGSYSVVGSVSGVAFSANFPLTNGPAPPASVSVSSGNNQSTTASTPFPSPLVATVRDRFGNPVPGVTVTFTGPATGAGIATASAVTDSNGNASAVVTANGTFGGPYSVAASVSGVASPAVFSETNLAASGTGAITLTGGNVGQNLEIQTTITLTLPAGSGPACNPAPSPCLSVTLTSSDPSKILIAGRIGDPGAPSLVVPFDLGTTQLTGIYVQALAGSGTPTINATANGYQAGTATFTLFPSGFVLAGPNGIGNSAFTISQGLTTTMTVFPARLDTSLNYQEVQSLRGGFSTTVGVTSSDTTVGTITTSPVTVNGGDTADTTTFTAVGAGGTTVTAAKPAGFSTPAGGANAVMATVTPDSFVPPTGVTVGNGLEAFTQIGLNGVAPTGGLQVVVTSNDPTKLLLSPTGTDAGSSSISLTVKAGQSHTPSFAVYGLQSFGSSILNISGTGFGSTTATINMAPSGAIIASPNGVGITTYLTATNSPASTFTVSSALLDSGLNFVTTQAVAGGNVMSVNVTSSNTSVGTMTTSPVVIGGSSFSGTTSFQPATNGSTTVSASAPGFSTPAQDTAVTVTVATPSFGLLATNVGNNGEELVQVTIGTLAPAGGIAVTLTSNNPSLLKLAANPTDVGANSIIVNIAANTNNASFYVQGFASSGTATVTASAPSFTSKTQTYTFVPSAPVIFSPAPAELSFFSTTVSAGPAPFVVENAQLDPATMNFVAVEQVAGGLSLTVNLSNGGSGAASVVPQVTISGGASSTTATVTPSSVGSATISVVGTAATSDNNVFVNVTGP